MPSQPAVAKVLSLTRALESLLDASDLDPCEGDVLALKLGNAIEQEKNIQTVAIMVNESQYYSHLLKGLLKDLDLQPRDNAADHEVG